MRTEFEEKIVKRLHEVWSKWQPDYEGWLKWSDTLYAPGSTIKAIGSEPQLLRDYQKSMKLYRDAFIMDMGQIETCIVEGNTVAHSYKMYMTSKANFMGIKVEGKCITIPTIEFNTFDEIPGFDHPMVVKLEVCAGGLLENMIVLGEDGKIKNLI